MKHPSPSIWLAIIQQIKDDLKTDSTVLEEICAKFEFEPEDIDLIPVQFGDIDVSGKTEHGVITLSWELLDDPVKLRSILTHEITHYASQSKKPTQSADDGSYLQNPDEQLGFQVQLKALDKNEGPQAAEQYVNQVLDHHNETGKERSQIKHELMEKVDARIALTNFVKLARQI